MMEVTIGGQKHTVWTCKSCGVVATCPSDLYAEFRKSGGYAACPNGHKWGWSKEDSEDEKIRRERDRLKQQIARKDDQIAQERANRKHTERQLSAQRGVVTKMKKRASAGLCPCCNRTFQNLHRHMQSQHPEYTAEEVA